MFESPAFQGWVLTTTQEAFVGVEFPASLFLKLLFFTLATAWLLVLRASVRALCPVSETRSQSQQTRQPRSRLSHGVPLSNIQRSINGRYKGHLLQDGPWTPPRGTSGFASPWHWELSRDSAAGGTVPLGRLLLSKALGIYHFISIFKCKKQISLKKLFGFALPIAGSSSRPLACPERPPLWQEGPARLHTGVAETNSRWGWK